MYLLEALVSPGIYFEILTHHKLSASGYQYSQKFFRISFVPTQKMRGNNWSLDISNGQFWNLFPPDLNKLY